MAEISELKTNASGHAYLELVEKDRRTEKIIAKARAKELQDEDQRKKELGLSEEELAFYGILALHRDAVKDYKGALKVSSYLDDLSSGVP